ncbi:ankyrin [Wilcoxina mikolae CBS 423.85]|nr:ankyrin [Wilcoxina mikolae CBS 423.85]
MTVPHLPLEILLIIASYLENTFTIRDLNSFLRVNRQLHRLINPCLYKLGASLCNERPTMYRYQSPIEWAIERDRVSTLSLLLDHGANLESRIRRNVITSLWWTDSWGAPTLLLAAVTLGREGIVHSLLKHGADANYSIDGEAPLLAATRHSRTGIARLLLAHGACVNFSAAPGKSETPLLAATARTKNPPLVRILLEAGADIAAVDYEKRTALHNAALVGDLEVIRFLVNAGANIRAEAWSGRFSGTPLDFFYQLIELQGRYDKAVVNRDCSKIVALLGGKNDGKSCARGLGLGYRSETRTIRPESRPTRRSKQRSWLGILSLGLLER